LGINESEAPVFVAAAALWNGVTNTPTEEVVVGRP